MSDIERTFQDLESVVHFPAQKSWGPVRPLLLHRNHVLERGSFKGCKDACDPVLDNAATRSSRAHHVMVEHVKCILPGMASNLNMYSNLFVCTLSGIYGPGRSLLEAATSQVCMRNAVLL